MSDEARDVRESGTNYTKEYQFPTNVPAAFDELETVKAQIDQLQTREKGLKKYLENSIPAEESVEGKNMQVGEKDGIIRKVTYRPSVSYSKALAEIKEQLVPKTKHGQADEIVEQHTKLSASNRFERMKD